MKRALLSLEDSGLHWVLQAKIRTAVQSVFAVLPPQAVLKRSETIAQASASPKALPARQEEPRHA